MKQIIKKDISWLLERVPDFMDFYNNQSYYFINDGYLAGGFLRKMIKIGSVFKAIEQDEGTIKPSDIDFFFYSEKAAQDSFDFFKIAKGTYIPTNPPLRGTTLITAPNSVTGFAYEGQGSVKLKDQKFPYTLKFQFIAKSTGTPEQVLNRFDISNCKIATDAKSVWMIEDWEEIEGKKEIRVDKANHEYLISRLAKYLGDDYSLDQSNHDVILKLMLGSSKYVSPIKKILRNKRAIKLATIVMFYGKLGRVNVWAKEPDYSSLNNDENLLGDEDLAINIYKTRAKEEQNENSASC